MSYQFHIKEIYEANNPLLKFLAKVYKSQVLGHVCLEQYEEYQQLDTPKKLKVKNELRLFYVKKPEYLEALRLIEKKIEKDVVIETTGISVKTYFKLLNNPIVRKYVYGENVSIKYENAIQKHLVTYDNLADNQVIDPSKIEIENFYYYEKLQ